MKQIFFTLSALVLVSACTQKQPANVVFKGGNLYDKSSETSRRVEATPVYDVKVRDLEFSESPSPRPALGSARRSEPQPRISIAENPKIEPLYSDAEFKQVLENMKNASAQTKQSVAPAALPAQKPLPAGQSMKAEVKEGFVWPVRGKVISSFGSKSNGLVNEGINIAAPEGKPVGAAADGEVVYAGNELDSYGNMVIVKHNNGWMTAYAHLKKMRVGLGELVQQGQSIGEVGKSGDAKLPQLHFSVRKDKASIDPLQFLEESVAGSF